MKRGAVSPKARASLLFALGKALDDVGDYGQAAARFGEANAIARDLSDWSRKNWRRMIDARLAAKPPPARSTQDKTWAPLFVVGVPRSGTTLVAEQLARHPQVLNRGELGWLAHLAGRLARSGNGTQAIEEAATTYAAQLHQDDAGDARWLIDKHPLNLLHLDLAFAMFPNARVVCCTRDARDTALSLWQQFFLSDAMGFAYDFADIAAVLQGAGRLAAKWHAIHGDAIRTVQYEALAADPAATLAPIRHWLGLEEAGSASRPAGAISTSSLWQARQPGHTRSIGRWKGYAPFAPGLSHTPQRCMLRPHRLAILENL